MTFKFAATALALALALPVLARTTATITAPTVADPCATTTKGTTPPADCKVDPKVKLGAGITPIKGGDHDGEGAEDGEDGDND